MTGLGQDDGRGLILPAPVSADVGMGHVGVLDGLHVLDVDHVADDTAPYHFAQRHEIRGIPQDMADRHDPSGFLGHFPDGLALLGRRRDGLFQQHVVAECERLHARLIMPVVRRGDDDGVGQFLSACKYFPEVPETHLLRYIVLVAQVIGPMLQDVRNADDFHSLRELPGIAGIGPSAVAAADDDDADGAADLGIEGPDRGQAPDGLKVVVLGKGSGFGGIGNNSGGICQRPGERTSGCYQGYSFQKITAFHTVE